MCSSAAAATNRGGGSTGADGFGAMVLNRLMFELSFLSAILPPFILHGFCGRVDRKTVCNLINDRRRHPRQDT